MAFEIGPYFMKVSYNQLGYGVHTMTHSIDEWIDTTSTNNIGRIRTQDGSDVDTLDGVTAFIDAIKPFFTADVSFNDAIIYKQLLSTDIPQPVAAMGFTGLVGTSGTPGWHVATEKTITYRSSGFNIFKLSFLDCDSKDNWGKVIAVPGSGILKDLHDYLTGDTNFVIARDGTYPRIFLSSTITLNEKLRKASGLT